jgi:hypothetical protein
MSAQASRTLGNFNVPAALPVLEFDSVNERVSQRCSANKDAGRGFASAWNGVAYRLRAALDHAQAFSVSVAKSTGPPPEERYRQDHDLFGFAVCGVSAIECCHFAAYCIGALLKPAVFPMSKPSDLIVYPQNVLKKFESAFPDEEISKAMRATVDNDRFRLLWDVRRVLLHRAGAPPRAHFLNISGPDAPSTIPGNLADLASAWRYDFELSPHCLDPYKVWLEESLGHLIKTAAAFTSTHL